MFFSANVVFVVNPKSLRRFENENVDKFENIDFASNDNVNILDYSKFVNDDRVGEFDFEDIIPVNEDSYFRKY